MPSHCLICLDNSGYMRNGDITPNRLEAQQEAAMKQVNKYLTNPESTVGLLSMAGEYPKVLIALGNDRFSLRANLAACKIQSKPVQLIKSMKKAQLAVKKRSNDDVGDRSIMVFIGSPIENLDEEEFFKLAAKLKKTNIGVTFINFAGEKALASNQEILQRFIEIVNSDSNSRVVSVPPGPHILSDMINQGEASSSGGSAMIDEDMDPDLAAAIRLSLMESRAQGEEQPQAPQPQELSQAQQQDEDMIDPSMDDDLALAIRLSLQDQQEREAQMEGESSGDDESEYDEEEEMQRALAMSMQNTQQEEQKEEDVDKVAEDEALLDEIIGDLPGMNKNNGNDNDGNDNAPMEDSDDEEGK